MWIKYYKLMRPYRLLKVKRILLHERKEGKGKFILQIKFWILLLNRSVCWVTDMTSILFWTCWSCSDGNALDQNFSCSVCYPESLGIWLFRSSFTITRWKICARSWRFDLFLLFELGIMLVPAIFSPRAFAPIFEWETIVDSFSWMISSCCWLFAFECVQQPLFALFEGITLFFVQVCEYARIGVI